LDFHGISRFSAVQIRNHEYKKFRLFLSTDLTKHTNTPTVTIISCTQISALPLPITTTPAHEYQAQTVAGVFTGKN
jgi:hypothetical protein